MPRRSPAPPAPKVIVFSKDTFVIQLAIGALACVTIFFLSISHITAFVTERGQAALVPVRDSAEIGIEHEGPVNMSFNIARKGDLGFLRIDGDVTTTIFVSVPQDWERTAVHGATLKEVIADAPEFGFIRWTLPAGAGISMRIPHVPDEFRFLSPSQGVATIGVTTVDLTTEIYDERTVLLQQESGIGLWDDEE